jgi:hypothetical protein
MSTMPPMTAQEITDIISRAMEKKGDLHAKITVARKTTVPGQTQYSSEGVVYQVEIDVPAGQKVIDAIHMAQADLNILVGEFKAAYLLKQPDAPPSRPSPSSSPSPALEWITSEKNPALEFLPADTPGAQVFLEWAKNKEKGFWLFDTGRGVLIFRKKGANQK